MQSPREAIIGASSGPGKEAEAGRSGGVEGSAILGVYISSRSATHAALVNKINDINDSKCASGGDGSNVARKFVRGRIRIRDRGEDEGEIEVENEGEVEIEDEVQRMRWSWLLSWEREATGCHFP